MIIFIIHIFIISIFSYKIAQRFVPEILERILTAFILVWMNLVVTALLLSCFILLGNHQLYFGFSVLLTLAIYGIVYRKNPYPSIKWKILIRKFFRRSFSNREIFLFITFLFFLCVNIVVAISFSPNNWDSLEYHLPRIHFYLGQGHLGHFVTYDDRMTFFPFNFELLQLACVTYGQPDWLLNFVDLSCWIFAGIALIVICRRIGLKTETALLSVWIGLTATQVLAQSTATKNDLPTAVSLLIGVIFIIRWLEERQWKDAVFAGIAFGLSAGSKVTMFFFWPLGFVIAGFILFRILKKKITAGQAFQGIRHWAIASLLAVILAAPFMMINYYYSKQLMSPDNNYMLNIPFSWRTAAQSIYAYSVQVVADPFQRMAIDMPGENITQAARNYLEPRVQKYLLPWWDERYAASDLYIFPPDLNEDHVWFGFAGPLIVLSMILSLFSRSARKTIVFWLGLASIIWLVTYCFQCKWSLYVQRYFIYAFLLSVPCTGYLIESLLQRSSIIQHFTRLCIVFVVTTSVLFGYIYTMTNTSRALPLIFDPAYSHGLPQRSHRMLQVLSQQEYVNIVYPGEFHWSEQIYYLMNIGRSQSFRMDRVTKPGWYNIYSYWSRLKDPLCSKIPAPSPDMGIDSVIHLTSSYITIALPYKRTPGLEFLGSIGAGFPTYDYYGYGEGTGASDFSGNNNMIMVTAVLDELEVNNMDEVVEESLSSLHLSLSGCHDADSLRVEVYSEDLKGEKTYRCTFVKDSVQSIDIPQPYAGLLVLVRDGSTNLIKGQGRIRVRKSEAGQDATLNDIHGADLINEARPLKVLVNGFRFCEGPYPQWDLPVVRWADKSRARLTFYNPREVSGPVILSMSFRPHIRSSALMEVRFNGKKLKEYTLTSGSTWRDDELQLTPKGGANTLEFDFPLMKNEKPLPDSLYMLFRTLSLEGIP